MSKPPTIDELTRRLKQAEDDLQRAYQNALLKSNSVGELCEHLQGDLSMAERMEQVTDLRRQIVAAAKLNSLPPSGDYRDHRTTHVSSRSGGFAIVKP